MTTSVKSITRRSALGTMAGGLAAAGFGLPAQAHPLLDLSNKEDVLTALVKMRGRTDGEVSMGWIRGTRYAVIDDLATPMWNILAGTFSRF